MKQRVRIQFGFSVAAKMTMDTGTSIALEHMGVGTPQVVFSLFPQRLRGVIMLKRILVGIADRSYTISATRHAIDVARQSGASLTGISVLDYVTLSTSGPVPIGASQMANEWRDQKCKQTETIIRDSFDAFARLCDDSCVEYKTAVRTGDPLHELVELSRYHDLVVVGLRHFFEHGLIPDPPDGLVKLVSSGVHPMLTVSDDYRPIYRVLIGYSGSVESARTLRCFAHHRELWPDAAVRIVSFGTADSDGPTRLIDARNYMDDHGIATEIKFIEGSAKRLLQSAEEWKADMIVLGNSAKSLLRRRVFGETAWKTIRESEIPLFLAQ